MGDGVGMGDKKNWQNIKTNLGGLVKLEIEIPTDMKYQCKGEFDG